MDDQLDRELTLQEIKISAYNRMMDAVKDYNEFTRKHYPNEATVILQFLRERKGK